MFYSSLDSSHRDESNDSKIIQIGVIFVEIAIFAKIIAIFAKIIAIFAKISGQIGSGQLSDPTRTGHRSKFGALAKAEFSIWKFLNR